MGYQMKDKICFILILLFGMIALSLTPVPLKAEENYSGRVIIKITAIKGTTRSDSKDISRKLNEINNITSKFNGSGAMKALNGGKATIDPANFANNIYIVDVENRANAEQLVSRVQSLEYVEYAEIDQLARYYEIPNDPLYGQMWNLNNIGQEYPHVIRHMGPYNDTLGAASGSADADIDFIEVYENPPVIRKEPVVAILDSGVDLDHPDLADNIWINPGEIAGDGIDNDYNGFIDDINGWDFGDLLFGTGDNDPTDGDGHGTHIAGTIAMVPDNAEGGIGIAPMAKIMAIKIDPLPLASSIALGVIYAADNGADVLNMSFGLAYPSSLMEDALTYADSKGVVLCAASGNSGSEEYNYPAVSEHVIAVGATESRDRVTSFSTYGSHIDISAPGQSILSLRANSTDMYAPDYPQEPGVHIVNDIYYVASGTSMACPHVVGTAAYIRAVSPGIKARKVKSILTVSADDVTDPYGAGWNLPGWDEYSGYGRVNLSKAIDLTPDDRIVLESPRRFEILNGVAEIIGTAAGESFERYRLYYGIGPDPDHWYEIESGSSPVENGVLANWDTGALNGLFMLRLTSDSEHDIRETVFIANEEAVAIKFPNEGTNVYGLTDISADVYGPDFREYRVDYKPAGETDGWTEIASGTQPIFDQGLTYWNTEELLPGPYDIRITMIRNDETELADTVRVAAETIFASDNAWKADLPGVAGITPNYLDLDQDGRNDIVVPTENGIAVFNTDGSIKSGGIPEFPGYNFIVPPAVGDVDGDGKEDLAVMSYDPPSLWVYPYDGTVMQIYLANFPDVFDFSSTEAGFPIVFLRDIDNDGKDEIFAMLPDVGIGFLTESDGSTTYQYDNIAALQPADLDGDGIDELYVFYDGFSEIRKITKGGQTLETARVAMDDREFRFRGISANDIDNDGDQELILFGYYTDSQYYLYFYDGGPEITRKPVPLGLGSFVVPTVPILADLDGDNTLEIISGYFDIDYSYIQVWRLSGESYLPGSDAGLFAGLENPGMLNMITVADLNGDYRPEIIASSNDDPFSVFPIQRIYAWDFSGKLLQGFPIVTALDLTSGYRYTPSVGDFDNNGTPEMIMTTADNSIVSITFPDAAFASCASPVPHWRYNRSLNGIGPGLTPCLPTDVDDDEAILPSEFTLDQNYPNPFNPVTAISFSLPKRASVRLAIYNILGRKVRTIDTESLTAGEHQLIWNGTDDKGTEVSSGIYLYRLTAGENTATRKMTLLK